MASEFDDLIDTSTGKRFSWSDYQKTDAYKHAVEINEAADRMIAPPDAPEELAAAYDAAMEALKEEKEETSDFTKESFDSFAAAYARYAVELLESDAPVNLAEYPPALRTAIKAVQELHEDTA